MTKLETIVLLLPIVFMIHEYEEIIMFQNWLGNNRNEKGVSRNSSSFLHIGDILTIQQPRLLLVRLMNLF